jgi:precorrin-6A/cobalt-precorrin-6A reductase
MRRVLILGGTGEARQLAERLVIRSGLEVMVSLAGRTEQPAVQPAPVRIGGFGGSEGLATFLATERFDALIDATHPYAAEISANAVRAATACGVRFLALKRPGWTAIAGDRWTEVDDVRAAVKALGNAPRRVFVAIGRKELAAFVEAPQHRYLIRSVDRLDPPLTVPDAIYVLGRGPFHESGDRALLMTHGVEILVTKNSGGPATYGKIAAARTLGLPVIMLRRPKLAVSAAASVETIDDAVAWLDHAFAH